MTLFNKIGQFLSGSGANLIETFTESVNTFVTGKKKEEVAPEDDALLNNPLSLIKW